MRPLRPAEQQWLFTPAQLEHTPSRDDGVDLATELSRRRTAIDHVRSLWLRVQGISDNVPAARAVLTVAAALIHRFYMRRSLADFPEELIAPTMLFLASKIEEEPLRVRLIVNNALLKFEPGAKAWEPSADRNVSAFHLAATVDGTTCRPMQAVTGHVPDAQVPAPLEYARWEKDVLTTEEAVLEALCFDMDVEQPWTVLRRAVQGMDGWWLRGGEGGAGGAGGAGGVGEVSGAGGERRRVKGRGYASESRVLHAGWSLLSETLNPPLCILFPAPVIAFVAFVLVVAVLDRGSLADELAAASDVAWRFGLDVGAGGAGGEGDASDGPDSRAVQACLDQTLAYARTGLIDASLLALLAPDPPEPGSYRRYRPRGSPAPASTPASAAATPAPPASGAATPAAPIGAFTPRARNGDGHRGGLTPA